MVDTGFPPHGRIHLSQQGGGNLNKGHTPLIGGGGKPGHVPHDAASQSHQRGAPAVTALHKRIVNSSQSVHGLVLLAIRQYHRVQPAITQMSAEGIQVERSDGLVGNHQRLTAADVLAQQLAARQQVGADINRVSPGPERDVQVFHGSGTMAWVGYFNTGTRFAGRGFPPHGGNCGGPRRLADPPPADTAGPGRP